MEEEQVENEKRINVKSSFKLTEVILIVLICTIIGIIIGYSLTVKFIDKEGISNKKITNDSELSEFITTYETINNKYYKDINKKELISSAINGMLSELDDPYSLYMNEEETKDFNERLEGSYKGIGVEITQNEKGEVYIINVFDNTPAAKAGLKNDDIFLKVNDVNVVGKTTQEISSMIKEANTSNVLVTIRRGEEELNKILKLKKIVLNSVSSKIYNNGNIKTGYIGIDLFAANTDTQFKTQLNKLEEGKITNLIIDVRDNSGGYLDVVTDMASLFLDKSKILYKIEEKNKITNIYSKTKEKRNYEIIVLTNEYSASASEILAAALKESYGAKTVGIHTYGKGTVQEVEDLSTGGMLKFTTQKWLTPNGNWVNEKGVQPDVVVEMNQEYINNPSEELDNQLSKALELLKK